MTRSSVCITRGAECPLSTRSGLSAVVRYRPIADISVTGDDDRMVSFYCPMTPCWVPPVSIEGLFRRSQMDRTVQRLRGLSLRWRWASADDWPRQWRIGRDFIFARDGGFGFVVRLEEEKLFLVPRGWQEPEWGLASYDVERRRWRDLGDMEPTPELWVFPAPEER